MIVVVLQLIGIMIFVAGTFLIGRNLRRHPTREAAERLSKLEHLLLYGPFSLPGFILILHPGLNHLDGTVGIPPLPFYPLMALAGALMLIAGSCLMVASNRALVFSGKGMAAFKLTQNLVEGGIYNRTRNAMSLGFYLLYLGVALAVGSSYLTIVTLFGLIPSHLFFLKYVEEAELLIRYGDSYAEYKKRTPFLIPKITHAGDGKPSS